MKQSAKLQQGLSGEHARSVVKAITAPDTDHAGSISLRDVARTTEGEGCSTES